MKNPFRQLFLNNPKTVIAIVVFVVVLFSAFATRCHAEDRPSELWLDVGSSVIRNASPVIGFTLDYPNGPVDTSYEIGLHVIGASDGVKNQGALTFMLIDGFGNFDIGMGVCLLHHTDRRNGSTANFALTVGYRFGGTGRQRVRHGHCSNAGMTDTNLGLDMLTYGWAMR